MSLDPDGSLRDAEVQQLATCPNISVIRFDGSLYFANTGFFSEAVLDRVASKPDLKYVIIDAEGINEIDATGEEMLHDLARRLSTLGIELLFARTKKQIIDILKRTGFLEAHGGDKFFRNCKYALNYVWQQLGEEHKETCPLYVATPLSYLEAQGVAAAEEAAAQTVNTDIAPAPDAVTEVVVTKVDVTKV